MEKAILQTLCYHDLFDYPLTKKEIYRFLIGKRSSLKEVLLIIEGLKKDLISSLNGFCFLKGREEIVSLRRKREKISKKKLKIAQKAASWLRLIPTIKMVALTGALAVGNAKKNDDIDFLIITSKNRLWLTRIQAVLLIELLGKRRRWGDKNVSDKICFNIFLDESHLSLFENKRNLFIAHEIVQMEPLWQRGDVYQNFIKANRWLKKFLPNWRN